MLILHEGGFCSIAHSELTEAVVRSFESGRRVYLIVPEQQTLTTEREMCDILPPEAPRSFEVTNFTRFTNTAFRALGGIGGSYSSAAERSLIMWRVLTELSPMLTMTRGRTRIAPGTVTNALSAVRELDSLGISPEMLSEVMKAEIRDERLKSKLSDLSLIYTMYKKLTAESYNDLGEDTEQLVRLLTEHPEFLDGCDVFIDGFISFTEAQYTLIGAMMKQCPVTVSLTLPRTGAELFEYTEVKTTETRLKQIAAGAGTDIKLKRPDSPDPAFSYTISEIGRLLWRTGGELDKFCLQDLKEHPGRVRIFEAETPFEECDFVAADIKRRVMEGDSFSDFAIVARSAESYVGILDNSLTRAGIPHFISKRRDISSFAAIKLINTAYGIVSRGFKREDVLTYVKCGLSGVRGETCDRFELYVKRWSIDGRQFTSGEDWSMNPRGYDVLCEEDLVSLSELNEAKDKIISPLLRLKEDADAAKTVREHAVALVGFLGDIGIEQSLYEKAKHLAELGENELAEENARLWETVCSSLDLLVGAVGDTETDAEGFITQLGVVFAEASIARLPSSVDRVTVGSADTLRVRGVRHVYLIGVNAGEFPATVQDNSYFSDRDKASLYALGLPIEPSLSVKNARELYSFTRALCLGRESVTLLYTSRSASMSALLPGDVIARLGDMSGGEITPVKIDTLSPEERIYTPNDAVMLSGSLSEEEYSRVREALSELGLGKTVKVAEGSAKNSEMHLGKEAVAIIYDGDLYLSQSHLDSFLRCPFSYFSKFVLNLSEDSVSELSSDVIGSFIHSVLENFFRSAALTEGGIAALGEEEKERIAKSSSESYISTVLGGGFGQARAENAISRLCRAAMPVIDGLCEEFSNCKFTPTFFELRTKVGAPNSPGPVVYATRDGDNVVISGIVDRVDTMKSGDDVYVRVIDYKSGSKEFSPEDMKEGNNLQMFLYLKSIVDSTSTAFRKSIGVGEGGKIIPAGVIYVKTSLKDTVVDRSDDESARVAARELSTREGMILDDEIGIGAMNPDFLPQGAEKEDSNRRFTHEGWKDICNTVKEAVLGLAEGIKSGEVSARPKVKGSSSPCNYCPYKPICRNARVVKY